MARGHLVVDVGIKMKAQKRASMVQHRNTAHQHTVSFEYEPYNGSFLVGHICYILSYHLEYARQLDFP